MFKQSEVPPHLWEKVLALQKEIKTFQTQCDHEWEKVMGEDRNYRPIATSHGSRTWKVVKSFHCSRCGLDKSFRGVPFEVCHQCGGKMIDKGQEGYGPDGHITTHKCENCDHEYQTT